MKKYHFTIVSYTFPPSNQIGGRRWAKFSQQLVKLGHSVTVITSRANAPNDFYKKEFRGINFYFLPTKYPEWLTGNVSTLFEKIFYFLAIKLYSPFTKQNLFDKGFRCRNQLLKALDSIHRSKRIDVLVVTGAPFSLLTYGAKFKQKNPKIFSIADFRDPWTWGDYYGIPAMGKRKKRFQEQSEKLTVETYDLTTYPTKHMGDFLKSKYPNRTKHFNILPHAFDPEKFEIASTQRKGFIYGGTLYNGIEVYLNKLSDAVKANPNLPFQWEIFTGRSYPLIDEDFADGKVTLNPFIPENELFKKIQASKAYLVFYPPQEKDLVSTKFFEIIYTETPIIYIGEEGEVGRFIRENNLGVHILPENIEEELPKYFVEEVPFVKGYFDVEKYTFKSVTENFLKLIEDKMNNE